MPRTDLVRETEGRHGTASASRRAVRITVLAATGVGATALSLVFPVFSQRHLFVLFFAYAIFAAWYGTFWESVGAVIYSAIATFIILPPSWSLILTRLVDVEAEVIFLVTAALLVLVMHGLRRAQAEAQVARAAAEEAVHQRDTVLSLVSHDLKNPLTSIKGYADLLQRRALSAPTLDSAQTVKALLRIDDATTKMTRLINELLDIARLQAGQPLALDRQSMDLVDLVHNVAAGYQQSTTNHHIRVEAALPALPGTWDAFRIERVLDNLLSNAVKYSPAGGDIVVSVRQESGWAVLAVSDQGLGIPAPDLPHLFELFHRAGNVANTPGTGIGLAMCKSIVEQHGGTITVESTLGRGTTVTVRLPLASLQAD